jgi:hypothetical protein
MIGDITSYDRPALSLIHYLVIHCDGTHFNNMTELTPASEQAQQRDTHGVEPSVGSVVAASGRRQAFQDLTRRLTPADLENPGTQKLILDRLLNAEDERDEYKAYVPLFHDVDKRIGVLNEKLKGDRINEIMFAVGIALGSVIIGLTPYFFEKHDTTSGILCIGIGVLCIAGSAFARVLCALQRYCRFRPVILYHAGLAIC